MTAKTITSAFSGNVSAVTNVTSGKGSYIGKVVSGGTWYKVGTITAANNEDLELDVTCKCSTTPYPGIMRALIGSYAGNVRRDYCTSGPTASQARICCFNSTTNQVSGNASNDGNSTLAYSCAAEHKASQLFQATVSGTLTQTTFEFNGGSIACRIYGNLVYNDPLPPTGTLLDTSVAQVAITGGVRYQRYKWIFTGNVAIVAASYYLAVWDSELTTSTCCARSIHPEGRAWVGSTPLYFSVDQIWVSQMWVAAAGGTEDVYVNGPSSSTLDVKCQLTNLTLSWTSDGTSTWPTSHSAGTDVTLDTDNTTIYTPNMTMSMGSISCPTVTQCSLCNGNVQLSGVAVRATIQTYYSVISCPKTTASIITTAGSFPSGWNANTRSSLVVTPYVIFGPSDTAGGNVSITFRASYSDSTNVNVAYPNDGSVLVEAVSTVAYKPTRNLGTPWVLSSHTVPSVMLFEIQRLAADTNDTYTGTIYIYDIGFLITVVSL